MERTATLQESSPRTSVSNLVVAAFGYDVLDQLTRRLLHAARLPSFQQRMPQITVHLIRNHITLALTYKNTTWTWCIIGSSVNYTMRMHSSFETSAPIGTHYAHHPYSSLAESTEWLLNTCSTNRDSCSRQFSKLILCVCIYFR